jgi:hypothetical protein
MKEIKIYKTVDGRDFLVKEDALIHENNYLTEENSTLQNKIKKIEFELKLSDECFLKMKKRDLLIDIPETSGVYMLTNQKDNYKKYIGSSYNLRTRYQNFLNNNRVYSGNKINEARKKYEPTDWLYTILEFCPIENLTNRENFYINCFNTIENGYNTTSAREITNNDKQENSKTYSRLKSAWESFETSLRIVYKGKEYQKKCEYLQHNVTREEYFNKRDNYQNKYKKEKLFTNFKIKTIEKNNNHVITIEDITFISQELYSLITPRMKYQITNGLKSGITYNTFNQLYTVKFNDETIETFKTEDVY